MKFIKFVLAALVAVISVYAISHLFAYLLTQKYIAYAVGAILATVLFFWVTIAGYKELKRTGLLAEIKKDPKAGFKKLMKCNYSIYY